MGLHLDQTQLEAIRNHGARDYPSECCGALLGTTDGDSKVVREVVALRNLRQEAAKAQELLPLDHPGRESERNRYLVDPRDQIRLEKDARARGLDVLGYYHSHPDHPARPSEYDREHAWPWYSYIILSVVRGEPREMTSWIMSDDRSKFDAELIELTTP